MGWPGLAMEVKEICEKAGVVDINMEHVAKEDQDEAILFANLKETKLEMEKSEKLKEVKNGAFRST